MRIPEGRLLVAKAGRMVEHARRGLRGLSAGVLALGVGCLLMTAFVIATEEQAVSAFLVLVVFGGMSGLVFAIVRRPGFAFIAITAFFISTFVASAFKFNFVAMNLHVYDAVFYLFSVASSRSSRRRFRAPRSASSRASSSRLARWRLHGAQSGRAYWGAAALLWR